MAMSIFKEIEKGSLVGLKRAISLYPNSVNSKNSAGATPLHVAAGLGLTAIVKELLVHGGQHDTTDSQGNLPLHLAAEQGYEETVAELLASRKTSAKTKNKEGQTALHLAVIGGHKAVVLRLLEANNRTDAKDKAGNTPLSLADDEEVRQILTSAKPPSTGGSIGGSAGPGTGRAGDGMTGSQRVASASGLVSSLGGSVSGRIPLPTAPSLGGSEEAGVAVGTPLTPRISGGVAQTGGRTPQPSIAGTPGHSGGRPSTASMAGTSSGSLTGRLPRSTAGGYAAASPGVSGGGSGSIGANGAAAQHQKYEMAIQSLKEGLRSAMERLGALDACTAAQLECAGQVEKVLETCGNHGRAILDLETRVAFQEERGRDARVRLERLEEGERSRQDSVKRLADDNRSLHSQLQKLNDQVAANNGAAQKFASSADIASHVQSQHQLQAEMAVLRAQLDQLSPALALATVASAEIRTLTARLDVLQQQQSQHPPQHAGGNVAVEQQILQLQAQVQLLQLPVATLTQQCTDLSSRMSGMTGWQQQTRGELTRLSEAVGQSAGDKLTDAVMGVLDTTARSLNELRQQQDETARQVALLLQQQQTAGPISTSPSAGPPTLPSTPQGGSQRVSAAGDLFMGPPGGPPTRNLSGVSTQGGTGRESSVQAELRAELESLKSLVADIRKEVVTEGGSLRREWQRAFSDMQSRYSEQTNELRAREANIAKLREAALVEEAERRAASDFEEKFAARLGKLETNAEYLTHRLEVLEEQVSGVVSSLAGATSPMTPVSPSRMAAALAAVRSQPQTSRSGPGPVSENHRGATPSPRSDASPTVAMAQSALSPMSPLIPGKCCSVAGSAQGTVAGNGTTLSDGGFPKRHVQLLGATGAKDPGTSSRAESATTSARDAACSARNANGLRPGSEEWWRAANVEQRLEPPGNVLMVAGAATPRDAVGTDIYGASTQQTAAAVNAGTMAVELAEKLPGTVSGSRSVTLSVPRGSALDPLSACADAVAAWTVEGAGEVAPNHRSPVGPMKLPSQGHSALTGGGIPWEGAYPEQGRSAAAVPTPCDTVSVGGGLLSARGPLPLALANSMSTSQQGVHHPGVAGRILDPANVALGPQLLTPVAHAMLTPSVDIQRLAAAAACQQQQYAQHTQEQVAMQQQQQQAPFMLPWGSAQQQLQLPGNPAVNLVVQASKGAGDATGPGGHIAPVTEGERQAAKSRKEPPMCLFCPMQ